MADFIDKAKHKAEELIGEAKEKIGHKTDNDDLAAEGTKDQVSGKTKQVGDEISDAASDIKNKFTN
ncbi:CsbD family protein [Rhodococcus sp. IEGM 1379]|uniref:CsbD family protein n=1 Tax=Rhodococcus sp. IEGM 1379 TaxID=3047086 RepID=UPI0024B87204|nr:CsbD family protein [Rhodococcus sp. IEGM 1379]MDI9913741.1 CsbD family protein [Rhodococcus sp. IEGM 1379]